MSITARSCRPARRSSQIACRFLIAAADRGVMPATYSRRTYRSVPGAGVVPRAASSPEADGGPSSGSDTEIQSNQDAFRVREIADDLLDRFRQPPHEGGQRENLVALRELRSRDQIDHLDCVAAVEVLLADLPQIREGQHGFRCLP